MKLSTDRILTTHVGSLPRPQALVDLPRRIWQVREREPSDLLLGPDEPRRIRMHFHKQIPCLLQQWWIRNRRGEGCSVALTPMKQAHMSRQVLTQQFGDLTKG